MKLHRSAGLGAAGLTLVAFGSYSAGAARYRGGIVEAIGLGWTKSGHAYGLFETMIWVGLVLFAGAWLMLGRNILFGESFESPTAKLKEVTRNLWWWIVPMALTAPLFSRDVYSYLMQGAMMRDGFDPYSEGAAVNPGPMLLEVSADWRNTTTPYGPLHLGIGEVITRIIGENIALGVVFYRVLCLLGFAAIAWSVPRIARALSASPALAMWLGVANPLVMLHVIAGLHNESMMVALVSLALVAALELSPVKSIFVSAVLIGLGVALKATAIIALPFIAWIVITRRHQLNTWADTMRKLPAVVGIGLALAAIMLVTLEIVTLACGSNWGWIEELSGNTKVINPLAAPSAIAGVVSYVMTWVDQDITFNIIVGYTRQISAVIMLVGLVVCWLVFRQNPRRNVLGMIAAYGVACVFNAVVLPWYYVSMLTVMGTIRPPRWLFQGTVLATLILSLSFAGGGNHRFYDFPWMIIVTIVAWLSTAWLVTGKASFSLPWRGSEDSKLPHGNADKDTEPANV